VRSSHFERDVSSPNVATVGVGETTIGWPSMTTIAASMLLAAIVTLPSDSLTAEDARSDEPSAQELLDRVFRNLYDADFIQVLRITSRSRSGRELSRRMQIVRRQTGGPGRALMRFIDPPDLRGTSLLVFQKPDRHDDVLLYLPAFERTRRISSAQRSDAFFGTDFTYEDLEPKQARDFVVQAVGTEFNGEKRHYLLDARPRSNTTSQYDRIAYLIDPQTHVVVRTEYYLKGSLWKRLETDASRILEVDGRFLPFLARMSNIRRGTETTIETESYELRREIPDSLFTETNLAVGDEHRDRSRLQEGR
jgi:hypothetical protein